MGFSIAEIAAAGKFCETVTIDALQTVVPPAAITQALTHTRRRPTRVRALTPALTLWIVIALHLYPTVSIAGVLRKLVRGLRLLWADPAIALPTESAIAYRRAQLGPRPLVALFKQVCQPIATPQTHGAFCFGLRTMAIDGTVDSVPDTPANATAFGRPTTTRGQSAFPLVRGVYLSECGTHAVVDAGFWPYPTSERVGGFRVLRSLTRGMLVMWDRGFHDYEMVRAARAQGAHVLSRLPAHVHPQPLRTLPDGSVLAALRPAAPARRRAGEHLLVRIITYTLTDPHLPGYGETYRVLTTLLNPRHAPAHAVACAYHERWEIEIVIDEISTHQRLVGQTLRSLTPTGVLQELYGILLAHYSVRVLMHQAALRADVDPDRLSFVHALEIVRDAVPEFQMVAACAQALLYTRLLTDIAAKRLPERRVRSNARVVKRKMSPFACKRQEHQHPAHAHGRMQDAVQICPPPTLDIPPVTLGVPHRTALPNRQPEPAVFERYCP